MRKGIYLLMKAKYESIIVIYNDNRFTSHVANVTADAELVNALQKRILVRQISLYLNHCA